MSGRTWSARVMAAMLLSLAVAAPASAADVATTVVVAPVSELFAHLDNVLTAAITPIEAPGLIEFEVSTDAGGTWANPGFSVDRNGYGTFTVHYVAGDPGTTVMVRAKYPGAPGYLATLSDPITIPVILHPNSVTSFEVVNTNLPESPVLPGVGPVRVGVQFTGPIFGSIPIEELVGDTWTPVGIAVSGYPPYGMFWLGLPSLAEGAHTFRASFAGSLTTAAALATKVVDVAKVQPPMNIGGATSIQTHHEVWLAAGVATQYTAAPTGTLTLKKDSQVVATGEPLGFSWSVPSLPIGTYTFTAEYSGDDHFLPSSAEWVLTVVADTVEATVGSLSMATFYPYRDGYKDTVTARGTRNESVSAAFTVRNSSGKTVRTGSVASGTGAYSWVWNGRTSSGAQVAAGSYTITTTLKDGAGTTRLVRQSVTVSSKRLYWYSTDLYKTASQAQKKTSSWGAWLFTMPSGVAYKSLRLYVYGRSDITFERSGFAPHDTRECPFSTVSPGCRQAEGYFSIVNGWSSVAVNGTYDRHGRYVRGYTWAGAGGHAYVNRLRLHVAYALLK
jgi:hypothetical protein